MNLRDFKNILNALADETRLRILNLLNQNELCVCDIMRVLKEPQSKVSRHLSYLRRTGLVEARRKRLWMHYRLTRSKVKIYSALLKNSKLAEFKKDIKFLKNSKDCLVACCP